MHSYLRTVGFSKVKSRKEMQEIIRDVMSTYDEKIAVENHPDGVFVEYSKNYGCDCGITVCGQYDEDNEFHVEYSFPFFRGTGITSQESVVVERHAEKESYSGLCDDINLGASLIFYLQNVTEYFNKKRYGRSEKNVARVALSGLSVEGKILFPVYQKMPVMSEIKASQERKKMLQAARDGDEDAIENLTLEDMDTYTMISKRIENEDILSIVMSHFMPCGVECDQYNVMGDILNVELRENNQTKEKIYVMTIEANGIILDVCINQQDLVGEPAVGRRFRGIIWLQGLVHFEEKW